MLDSLLDGQLGAIGWLQTARQTAEEVLQTARQAAEEVLVKMVDSPFAVPVTLNVAFLLLWMAQRR